MSSEDDLAAFLRARLDEDEAAAYKAAGGLYRGADHRFGGRAHWSAPGRGIVTDTEDPEWGVIDLGPCIDDDALAVHITRHDPARVLREVTAKRDILTAYIKAEVGGYRGDGWITLRFAMETLAAAWSEHPDYREEWGT